MSNEKDSPRIRRKYAAEWAALNTTLPRGELVCEMDTSRLKVGDGVSDWASLEYVGIPDLDGVLDTGDVTEIANKRYVTNADLTKLANTSGINTGDQDLSTLVPKTTTVNGHSLSSNITVTQSDVGLSNVDNTSDANKPVSTATQTALNLKADLASPTFTGTVGGITAAMVGAPSGSGTSSGTNTGDQTTITGNAATATTLQTARTIDGVSFDGSANILVVSPAIDAAPSKATPVDADKIGIWNSVGSVLGHVTWVNLKATLKTYFDTLYSAAPPEYISPQQIITPAGTLSLSHGLSATPNLAMVHLVCITAEHGYSAGQVATPSTCQSSGNNQGVNIGMSSSSLGITYGAGVGGSPTPFTILHKTTGAQSLVTPANWRAVFSAWIL